MRLIDADALIENIGKIVPSTDYYEFASQICNAIRNQPTAYDVENVVAELKEWTFNADINIGDGTIMNRNLITSKNAIDIVERGGVE